MARPSSEPEASSSRETRDSVSDLLIPATNVAQNLLKELGPYLVPTAWHQDQRERDRLDADDGD